MNSKKDLTRRFRNKLFNDLLDELKKYKEDDVEYFQEFYDEMDGASVIILLLARDIYNYSNDMDKFKDRLIQIVETSEERHHIQNKP